MTKTVKEAMTPFPHTIGDEQNVETAKHQMQQHRIRHLPVLHGGRCIGMLSDRDIALAYAVDSGTEGAAGGAGQLKVKDVCTLDAFTVLATTPLKDVATHLAESGIGSAVVVDEREKVIGIFTVTDACRVLSELLAA